MTWVPPHPWAAGDDATSGNLQSLTDAINYLHGGAGGQRPTIEVTTGSYNAANNTYLSPTGLTASNDTNSGWNSTTGVYTISTPGVWVWAMASTWTFNATGVRGVTVANTSGAFNWVLGSTDGQGRVGITTIWRHAAGATVSPQIYQNSGGTLAATSLAFLGVWLCG